MSFLIATFAVSGCGGGSESARRMGTSLDMIDRTSGHLAPDAEAVELALLNAYDTKTEKFGRGLATESGD